MIEKERKDEKDTMAWPADCGWGFKRNMSRTTKVYAMRCYATRSFGMEDATKRGG
jgi:hypothetical protein